MSASTQGTPSWLLRIEQIQSQLTTENYITWLLTKAKDHDIPDEVIEAQLERNGYVATEEEEAVAEELQPPQEEVKRKAGRPRKQQ